MVSSARISGALGQGIWSHWKNLNILFKQANKQTNKLFSHLSFLSYLHIWSVLASLRVALFDSGHDVPRVGAKVQFLGTLYASGPLGSRWPPTLKPSCLLGHVVQSQLVLVLPWLTLWVGLCITVAGSSLVKPPSPDDGPRLFNKVFLCNHMTAILFHTELQWAKTRVRAL